jgi:surface antigen
MRAVRSTWVVFAGALALGCSDTREHTFGSPSHTSVPGGAVGGGTGGSGGGEDLLDGGLTGFDAAAPDCAAATKLVYLIDALGDLYRFDPQKLEIVKVGPLACPAPFQPYSMAVRRDGQAFVVDGTGHLFQASTTNGACAPTTFAPGQDGFTNFGMGFSTDVPGGAAETLWVSEGAPADGKTHRLARVDLGSMTLTPVGAYDAISARAELTGTGEAELYGAFEGSPYVVAKLDKTSAHQSKQAPQNAINYPPNGSNFAFAFWGGDFWLFVGPGTKTDIFQYEPAKGTTTLRTTIPQEIVGAGVSTCAPTVPPS